MAARMRKHGAAGRPVHSVSERAAGVLLWAACVLCAQPAYQAWGCLGACVLYVYVGTYAPNLLTKPGAKQLAALPAPCLPDSCPPSPQVGELVRGRVLVGHAIMNDLRALLLEEHPKHLLRDTAK
jgi:hypothetical protein